MGDAIKGTEGYTEQAKDLLECYESFSFEEAHAATLSFMPSEPSLVLDIGAGTGRDAAHFAKMGNRVVAVEPTGAFRLAAARLHPSPSIEWLDDSLPELKRVVERGACFDLVMMTAVWMHLDETERRMAMPVVASLIPPGGRMIMSLRHGPFAPGRRMFAVTAQETVALAAAEGLISLANLHLESVQDLNRRAGITWSNMAFEKRG